MAKAYANSSYPLTFKPTHEGEVEGHLQLVNQSDGTEHSYHLKGIGKRPLALDHLVFDCVVGDSVSRTMLIPNATRRKLLYQVESDLNFVTGKETVSVLPGRSVEYTVILNPNKRGHYHGIVAFVAGSARKAEYDSDGDEIPPVDDDLPSEYRVWYSVEVDVQEGPAAGVMDLSCPCHKAVVSDFHVENPLDEEITVEVEIQGDCLYGDRSFTVAPKDSVDYQLSYQPSMVGDFKGCVIFFNDLVGEFWYDLNLTAVSPPITVVDALECEIGKFITTELILQNPSSSSIELQAVVSNANNYCLELDHEGPIVIPANETVPVVVRFTPSDLGFAEHACRITFHSKHLGEWIFELTGSGLLPKPRDPVCVTAAAGTNTTLLIPFHNPLDVPVLCDVVLTDNDRPLTHLASQNAETPSPFCLLLKHDRKIRVGPKSTLDIPVSFAPLDMRQYEALCVVISRRKDGSGWHFSPEDPRALPRSKSGGIQEIRWRYPMIGVPESTPSSGEQHLPQLVCQARSVSEERLEIWLAGVAPAPNAPQNPVKTRAKTPADVSEPPAPIGSSEPHLVNEPFVFDLIAHDASQADILLDTVRLELIRQHRDALSGMLVLTFGAVLKPHKSFRIMADLVVKSGLGGVWRYPIEILSTEPEPDDVIAIHATGLNRETWISFRLNSQSPSPAHFNAFFEAGSDVDFSVSPTSGELPSVGSPGLLFNVCFRPTFYGKPKRARLIVQSNEMEWIYVLVGEIPEYWPPVGQSFHPISGPHPDPRHRSDLKRNFVRENIKLITTGVSSPQKGAPVLPKLCHNPTSATNNKLN